MKKRLLTVLLAVCLVLALGTVSALADDTLPASGEITLDSNVVLSSTWSITGDVVLDLNGNSISVDSTAFASGVGYAIDIQPGGSLTVNDSGSNGSIYSDVQNVGLYLIRVLPTGELIVNDGTIENNYTDFSAQAPISNFGTVTINGGEVNGSTLMRNHAASWAGEEYSQYFDESTILNVTGGRLVGMDITTAIKHPEDPNYIGFSYGVSFFGSGIDDDGKYNNDSVIVNISGGYIEADQALATNASSGKYAGFTLNVTDGTINGTDEGTAMYLPGIGNTTISGGTITGAQGIRIASGELNITRGEIISTAGGDIDDIIAGGSGGTNGALVIGKAGTGYVGDLIVNVSGTASIQNTSGKDNPTAIFVTDKTMENAAYADTVIDVNVEDVSIEGNVVRASNLSGSGTDNKSDTTALNMTDVTVFGDVINQSESGGMTVDNSVVNGTVTVSDGDGTIAVLNSSVESKSGSGIILVNTSVGDSGPTTDAGGNVAIVDGVGYTTLASAIAAADDGDTVTLVDDVDEQFSLTIQNKDITIAGNGFDATITPGAGATTKALSLLNSELTLDGVNMTINGTENSNGNYDGTAFDVRNDGSVLNVVNNSVLNMNNLESAMVFADTSGATVIRGKLNIEDSTVNFTNIDGNASNGGDWKVADSTVTFSNCGSHAMSVETLVANNSDIDITGAGLCGLYGHGIELNSGTDVTITNSGSQLPKDNWTHTATYKYPVEIKKVDGNCGLTVNSGASITLADNAKENNVIYMPNGTTLVNDGTLNATVVVDENSDMNVLVFFDNGVQCDVQVVNDGKTYTFTAPTRSGYEFRGWRDNSGKLHKAGDVVTVDSDMTFTAVWSAINIPDTYDIEIADAANGSVDTSLSNASAGSTITITATPDSGYSVASVTVTGPDGRVDVVRVNATTYTFKMPAGDVTVRVTFTDSDALPFTDVSAGQWFYDAVAYVYTNGMMEGDSATTFNPDGTMTRAMFWAVLGRIDGATITGANWADQARDWAMAEGVSDGTDPNGLVTREQMVTMLWRYAGEPESTASLSAYTDAASVSDWAETAMRWAIDEGIITGMTDTTLVPQGTATRAQCAAIFMRFDQM